MVIIDSSGLGRIGHLDTPCRSVPDNLPVIVRLKGGTSMEDQIGAFTAHRNRFTMR
jgi:hypothetical protein